MLFKNPRKLISEAASADLLDPAVSEEVKDTIDELEDTLTNNVEEVKEEDKATNGGIPITTEAVAVFESAGNYNRARYLIKLEDVVDIQAAEGAEKAAEENPGEAPSEEECEKCEPEAVDVVETIAKANGVDEDEVAVVISKEQVSFLAECAILEAKCGKKGKKAKATKKLAKQKKVVDQLKGKVTLVKA